MKAQTRNGHVSEAYDAYAAVYDDEYVGMRFDHEYWRSAAKGGRNVCELGCGTGRISSILAQETETVCGVDISSGMLARARSLKIENASFVEADFCSLPFEDETFDRVFAVYGSFAYLVNAADRIDAVQEMSRVCRAGGALAIDVPYYSPGSEFLLDRVVRRLTHTVQVQNRSVEAYWSSEFDPKTGTLAIDQEFVDEGPSALRAPQPTVRHRTHVYTPSEIEVLLRVAGSESIDTYESYERVPFEGNGNRIIIEARKL